MPSHFIKDLILQQQVPIDLHSVPHYHVQWLPKLCNTFIISLDFSGYLFVTLFKSILTLILITISWIHFRVIVLWFWIHSVSLNKIRYVLLSTTSSSCFSTCLHFCSYLMGNKIDPSIRTCLNFLLVMMSKYCSLKSFDAFKSNFITQHILKCNKRRKYERHNNQNFADCNILVRVWYLR